MRLALAAGETSGDLLGADLLHHMLSVDPALLPAGIGGPALSRAGCRIWQPMDRLSVMGLWEVLGRLPELLALRRRFLKQVLDWRPDLYLGIDAPDFNFPLEQRLRARGIVTVHYVSPSLWAWRPGRVDRIRQSTDHVLCLLPFEPEFYARHGVTASFTGHPFARQIAMQPDRVAARRALGLDDERRWIALLPGSRHGEIQRLAPPFLQAARRMLNEQPTLGFALPAANPTLQRTLLNMLHAHGLSDSVRCFNGQARTVLQACDTGLIASGTATLEAMLCKLPMVVSYRLHPLTIGLIRSLRLMKTAWYSLPNILEQGPLVDECMQEQATADNLARAMLALLHDPQRQQRQRQRFEHWHHRLMGPEPAQTARMLMELAPCR